MNLKQASEFLASGKNISLSESEIKTVSASQKFLQEYLKKENRAIYGVNTGFGSLYNVQIPEEKLSALQENLLITHAAGTGAFLDRNIVKCMLWLKVQNILKGHSAVSPELLERIVFFYNNDLIPAVHSQGSLGASGDLAPLAELFLPLIGLGSFDIPGKGRREAASVLKEHGLQPLTLGAKEALALINGTQFMLAHGIKMYSVFARMRELLPQLATLSLDAFDCRKEPFFSQLHHVRPHPGQVQVASEIIKLMATSPRSAVTKQHVQDPYSFRCIPQVHGASYDALDHCFRVFETELNSVTDNPNVFPEDDLILSGGNFHGQPLALSLDFAALALAELGSISERRTYLLVSGQRGLPPFLSPDAGLDSGFMIAQYSAAALVSQNKQLCTPASVDSIMSSNGQEDHVSMGANAAIKSLKILENLENILAIEFLCAANAMAFREERSAPSVMEKLNDFRKNYPGSHQKIPMHELISYSREFLFN